MISALSVVLVLPGIVFFFITVIFSVEVFAASLPRRASAGQQRPDFGGRLAVLVPAHNEQAGISDTLRDIKGQMLPGDRLVVVADNCTDDTSGVATDLGAEVTRRFDSGKLGKGYALDWGLEFLAPDPPDVVIIVDADCRVGKGALRSLASEAFLLNRPVQALYVMTAPAQTRISQQVAEFAWRVKNHVRPLGLKLMNLPCQLMGTGMAFPWNLVRSINVASGHIVEDLQLGLDLARLGAAPTFHPEAIVSSTFPASAEGISAQRQRWEHGHINLIGDVAIPLLCRGIAQKDRKLTALSIDLLVPPVSLLGLAVMATLIVSALAMALGVAPYAFYLSVACLVLLATATLLAWWKFGADILPARSLLQIPVYLTSKIPVYAKLVLGRGVSNWVRTDRT